MKIILPLCFFLILINANKLRPADRHKEELENDRDDFDEKLMWGGDEDFDPDDDPFDDWHPDELDESVRIERFEKLVRKMDEDKDSFVSYLELVHWTLRALQNMDSREMASDFSVADGNSDGFVSWEEYVQNIFGVNPEEAENMVMRDLDESPEYAEYNRMFHREHAKFGGADANEDGKLTEDEYVLFYNPGKNPEQTQWAIKEAMEQVDKNGDGKLSKEEFLNDFLIPGSELSADDKEGEEDVFSDLDLNSNGFLDGEELVLWIQQDNAEIAVDEASHLRDLADQNDDGKLSYDEMIEAMEEFIESDATEYGYQLKHDEL